MKKNSAAKRLLAVFLAVLMLPSFAILSFAEEYPVYEVATEDEMEAAVKAVKKTGGTIVLTDSIAYNTTKRESLFFGEGEVVFDLGGNELTLVDKTIYNAGCLMTIKNGTLTSMDTIEYPVIQHYFSDDAVTYLLDDLTINAQFYGLDIYGGTVYSAADIYAGYTGIYNCGDSYDGYPLVKPSDVYVTGGTISSADDYAVNNENSNANMYISDATLISRSWMGTVLNWCDEGTNTLTINNSKIFGYEKGYDSYGRPTNTKGLYLVGGNVTVENSEVYCEYGDCIMLFDESEKKLGCNLTCINSVFYTEKLNEEQNSFCLSTNHNDSAHSTAYLSGCKFYSPELPFAIYWPVAQTLTIDDAAGDTYIAAKNTAIEIRNGQLDIADDPDNEYSVIIEVLGDEPFGYDSNGGSGPTIFGAAIAISQHVYNEPITVNISGGRYNAPYAVLEEDVLVNQLNYTRNDAIPAGDVVVNIHDGKFTGKVENKNSNQHHNEYLNVAKGVFTDIPEGVALPDIAEYEFIEHKQLYILADSVYEPEACLYTEIRNAAEATCCAPGYTGDLHCAECGTLLEVGEEIPVLGKDAPEESHTAVIIVPAIAPTCKDDGYSEWKMCEDCGAILDNGEVIPATGDHVDEDGDGLCDACNLPMNGVIPPILGDDDAFRCKFCKKYEANKDRPVIGIFYRVIHFFIHNAHKIGHIT